MANAKEIKNRMNSIKDTQKITNAMYLIASTKLRKAKMSLFETYPYFEFLRNEAQKILSNISDVESKYILPNDIDESELDNNGKTAILCISADKGLAGAYNSNIIKETLKLIDSHKDYTLYVIGEYGKNYFKKHRFKIDEGFLDVAREPDMDRARRISETLLEKYDNNEISQIYMVYTEFSLDKGTNVHVTRILPFSSSHFDTEELSGDNEEYLEVVPSPNKVLDTIVENYIIGYIYSGIVEGFCAEQNSRMMAMDSANENAKELLSKLNLKYNKIRQSMITQEITEISSGAKSLKQIKEALH